MDAAGGVGAPSYTARLLVGIAVDEWDVRDGILIARTGRSLDQLTVKQLCNLVYADLMDGRNPVQKAEMEVLLAPPDEREKAEARKGRLAQEALMGMGMPPPPRPPVKRG